MSGNFNIIKPVGLKPRPDRLEEQVAEICAQFFQSDVRFILRGHSTTPDIEIVRTRRAWEIKNIKGCGRHTIEDNLRKASKQSERIIISLLAAPKLDPRRTENRIRVILNTKRMPIKSVLLVTRDKKVVDIKLKKR